MNNLGKLMKNLHNESVNCFQTFHLSLTGDLFCIHFNIPNDFRALSPPLEDD